jgi:hypothetical protein
MEVHGEGPDLDFQVVRGELLPGLVRGEVHGEGRALERDRGEGIIIISTARAMKKIRRERKSHGRREMLRMMKNQLKVLHLLRKLKSQAKLKRRLRRKSGKSS